MRFFQGEISTILAEGRVAEEKNRQEQKWEDSTRTIEIFFLDPEKPPDQDRCRGPTRWDRGAAVSKFEYVYHLSGKAA